MGVRVRVRVWAWVGLGSGSGFGLVRLRGRRGQAGGERGAEGAKALGFGSLGFGLGFGVDLHQPRQPGRSRT